MIKEEKEQVFNLLKKADCYINGFNNKIFSADIEFFDDEKQKAHGKTILDINEKIAKCQNCKLCETRNNVILGDGVTSPLVLVILDAPNNEQDNFGGEDGELLEKMLLAIGLEKSRNCYITNIIKCKTPQNREPHFSEIDACFSFLQAQITLLKPKMILSFSRLCVNKLLGLQESISNIHGRFFEYNNIPLMATFSPSSLNKNKELKGLAWNDLKQFKIKLDNI